MGVSAEQRGMSQGIVLWVVRGRVCSGWGGGVIRGLGKRWGGDFMLTIKASNREKGFLARTK